MTRLMEESVATPEVGTPTRPASVMPLILEVASPGATVQPVRVGLPLVRGRLRNPLDLTLRDDRGRSVPCQAQALARWSDGSIRWLLLDFLAETHGPGRQEWALHLGHRPPHSDSLTIDSRATGITIDTSVARFHLDTTTLALSAQDTEGGEFFAPEGARWMLTDPKGRVSSPKIEQVEVETNGPLRATIRLEGRFDGKVSARFVTRLSFHASTALVRIDFTLHNPQRAQHRGGLWDLSDSGSMLFRDISLGLPLGGTEPTRVRWTPSPDCPARSLTNGNLEIFQGSSGGENCRSPNHVNREGRVPCSLEGYRVAAGGEEQTGLRASPVVSLSSEGRALTVAISDFWQQFPKALEISGRTVWARLFPAEFGDSHPLAGSGEQRGC